MDKLSHTKIKIKDSMRVFIIIIIGVLLTLNIVFYYLTREGYLKNIILVLELL